MLHLTLIPFITIKLDIEAVEQVLKNYCFYASTLLVIDLSASLNYLGFLAIEVVNYQAWGNTVPRAHTRHHRDPIATGQALVCLELMGKRCHRNC